MIIRVQMVTGKMFGACCARAWAEIVPKKTAFRATRDAQIGIFDNKKRKHNPHEALPFACHLLVFAESPEWLRGVGSVKKGRTASTQKNLHKSPFILNLFSSVHWVTVMQGRDLAPLFICD